ncbi:sodium:solute symporter family transporter, partial [Vibrio parahaemolyticus]
PVGVKGVVFAALAAAIVSSLASMLNSTATIFTMDIYKEYISPDSGDHKLVNVGRTAAVVALIIACLIAPMLG